MFSQKSDQQLIADLAALIKKKFAIDNVQTSEMSILLDDNAFVTGVGRQNNAAVLLLQASGATTEAKVPTKGKESYSYCTHTKCTLTRSQCETAIKAFGKLPDATEDFKKESKNIISAC
jgi:hypothetical protein